MGLHEERESIVLENHGQKIFGIIHKPKVAGPLPAVLMCHGLGGHKTGKYRLYVLLAEKLAEYGIATLRIDFRGCGDSEGHFSDMTIEGEVGDALLAIKYLHSLPWVDKNRIGIFGRSIGGTVAIITAGQSPYVKSLGVWAPLYDGHQWRDKWSLLHSPELSEEHKMEMMRVEGQLPGKQFFYELFGIEMEPLLDKINTLPMLHIHGEIDAIITLAHAEKFKEYRGRAKGANNFILLPQGDHDFSNPKEQQKALMATCEWFKATLQAHGAANDAQSIAKIKT